MNIIGILLLVIHIVCCTGLILVVLLQAGKGASLGAAFGGGSSQTVFGAGSASFIGKMTWVMAGAFMVTSLLLTMISPWGNSGMRPESAVLHEEPVALPPLGEPAVPALPGAIPPGDDMAGDLGPALPVETPPAPFPAEPVHEPAAPQPAGQP